VSSIGSVQLQAGFEEKNVTGFGDRFNFYYTNTLGSNRYNLSYTLPLNPRNGTVKFTYETIASTIVEEPFQSLDIESQAGLYEVSLRQPLLESPTQELAVGLNLTYEESNTSILDIPFPLSPGASEEGKTKVSAIRFFQEWFTRTEKEVLAFRSQFSFGVEALGSTINRTDPDSTFFSWRGQGQWVRQLAPDTLLLFRSDLQVSDRPLVPLEQFTLGGLNSVRGYPQDFLISDNGFLVSGEVRIPIWRVPQWQGLLQVTPFVDVGTAWNVNGGDFDPNTLAAVGLGLYWQQGQNFNFRFSWGIPLVPTDIQKTNWQDNGLYFSVYWSLF
jgi:hemolysin activation/secretion protein